MERLMLLEQEKLKTTLADLEAVHGVGDRPSCKDSAFAYLRGIHAFFGVEGYRRADLKVVREVYCTPLRNGHVFTIDSFAV
jgi:hypothetical protein